MKRRLKLPKSDFTRPIQIRQLTAKLRKLGYQKAGTNWYNDGVIASGPPAPRPKDASCLWELWEPVWNYMKQTSNFVFRLEAKLAVEFDAVYVVMELSAYPVVSVPLHNRTDLRGPLARFAIADIIAEATVRDNNLPNDLGNLPRLEALLAECLGAAAYTSQWLQLPVAERNFNTSTSSWSRRLKRLKQMKQMKRLKQLKRLKRLKQLKQMKRLKGACA